MYNNTMKQLDAAGCSDQEAAKNATYEQAHGLNIAEEQNTAA